MLDADTAWEMDTGFYWEIVEPFAFQIHNRYTGYCLKVEANQYQRARYFDETGKRNDSYDWPLNVDCFYEFYPKDVDGDGVYELCTAQYTWDNAHVDGVGDARCVLKYDTATKSFRVVQAEFVPYEE